MCLTLKVPPGCQQMQDTSEALPQHMYTSHWAHKTAMGSHVGVVRPLLMQSCKHSLQRGSCTTHSHSMVACNMDPCINKYGQSTPQTLSNHSHCHGIDITANTAAADARGAALSARRPQSPPSALLLVTLDRRCLCCCFSRSQPWPAAIHGDMHGNSRLRASTALHLKEGLKPLSTTYVHNTQPAPAVEQSLAASASPLFPPNIQHRGMTLNTGAWSLLHTVATQQGQ
jgi:hypothetical protein